MTPIFPLKYRIAAVTGTIAGILLMVVIWQGLVTAKEQAQLEKSVRQEVFISFMEDICRTALLREEYDVLQTYLWKLTKGDPTIHLIRIADHRGVVVASTRPADLGRQMQPSLATAGTAIVREVRNAAGPMGAIAITFIDPDEEREFAQLLTHTISISVVGLVILCLASLAIGAMLTRRLQDLTLGVQRIADGDLEVTVPETGRDEVMLLGTAINRMTRRLRSLLDDLREQSDHIRTVTDTTLDAIVSFDGKGVVRSMNPAARRIFGRNTSVAASLSMQEIIPDAQPELWQAMGEEENGILLQTTGRHAGGREFPAEAAVSRTLQAGQPLYVASIRDVSERKHFEETLTRLNQELEQRVQERTAQLEEANRELESFSYSVSHDLRAPLRHINGYCQMLDEECGERMGENGTQYLQRVCTATDRMGALIDSLLSLSRLGRQTLERRETDLTAMARELAADIAGTDRQRRVEWRIADGLTAWADPAMARSVLENLLENAWKYTSRTGHAVITLEAAGSDGAFVVRDNGAGFDMRYADKLFAPFQRLHGPAEFEGSGVGLATVQRIIHRHGGRIWADSAPDQGAAFYFTFGRE
jgi:hypothetical protein